MKLSFTASASFRSNPVNCRTFKLEIRDGVEAHPTRVLLVLHHTLRRSYSWHYIWAFMLGTIALNLHSKIEKSPPLSFMIKTRGRSL